MEARDYIEQQDAIRQTVLEQIKAMDAWALMAYGAEGYQTLAENNMYRGGVSFRVNGLAYVGLVEIALMWNDTYRIRTFSPDMSRLKDEVTDVYFDMLVDVLDRLVEGRTND